MRLPSPKPHPGIMGVKVWPSLSVRENRLPSPSMTFRDDVSIKRAEGSSSAVAVAAAARIDIRAPRSPPSAIRRPDAWTPDATKLIGAPSATAAIAAGSPHGGMSRNALLSSMSPMRSRAYAFPYSPSGAGAKSGSATYLWASAIARLMTWETRWMYSGVL